MRATAPPIADLAYHGRHDVVLLEIDPSRVQAEVRVETLDGAEQPFPHIYGPLPVDAITQVTDLRLGSDGRLIIETAADDG